MNPMNLNRFEELYLKDWTIWSKENGISDYSIQDFATKFAGEKGKQEVQELIVRLRWEVNW